jgi:divalent metal cation (Fe/Co/Zn/Cd) transporter
MVIGVPRTLSFEQTHELTERIEQIALAHVRSLSSHGDIDILVHTEPIASHRETLLDNIYYLANKHQVHVHDIHIREVDGLLEADFDLEVQSDLPLKDAHAIASQLEADLVQNNPHIRRITTHLETTEQDVVQRREVTHTFTPLLTEIRSLADTVAGRGSSHDLRLYSASNEDTATHTPRSLDLVLHLTCNGDEPLSQVHIRAEKVKRKLRSRFQQLDSIIIHTEPPEEATASSKRSNRVAF